MLECPTLLRLSGRTRLGTINAILNATFKLTPRRPPADAWASWLVSYNVISPQTALDLFGMMGSNA